MVVETHKNKIIVIKNVENTELTYSHILKTLQKMQKYIPWGKHGKAGINFTIIENYSPDYVKVLFQRSSGDLYWNNPIDVLLELFWFEEKSQLTIEITPNIDAETKKLELIKVLVTDKVMEIWENLGLDISEREKIMLLPIEDIELRNRLIDEKLAEERKMGMFIFIFCIVMLVIAYIIDKIFGFFGL